MFPHAPNRMQEFSHNGGNGLQRLFSGGDKLVIKGFNIGLMANSHQGWHIQGRPQILIAGLVYARGRWTDWPDS